MKETSAKNIDNYIRAYPKEVQSILRKIRRTIKTIAPKAEEVISYQIPAFKLDGKYIVYFSAWKHHVSLYPLPRGSASLKKEIAPYVAGKGTIRFALDEPIPYGLVKKIIKAYIKNGWLYNK